MRIVQTFWSANGNLLRNSYGWAEPQYHLMSWALSCLSLRENYDEVVLYTDSIGYKVFAELLKLPYSDIIIQYDDLRCPRHQWAYSKVQTYSLQKKPFLHIDGDIYLPKKFEMRVEQGGIVAQNRELGTEYYEKMVNRIKSENILFPDFLQKELLKKSIPSYNAGVLGGNDIEFIQKYCQAVFNYINSNDLFNIGKNYSCHNILFEQILLSALAADKHKEVTTVIEREIKDNGYSYSDFCDFYSFEKSPLMHVIGGHKKRERVCELLSQTLLNKYPEYYERIIELFPEKHMHIRHQKKRKTAALIYLEHKERLQKRWQKIPYNELFDLERKSSQYLHSFNLAHENNKTFTIKRNPYLSVYEKQNSEDYPQSDMALIPCLLNKGFQEIPIDDLAYNILAVLEDEHSIEYIQDKLQSHFQPNIAKDKGMIEHQIKEKLEYLFYNKLIYTNTI